MKRKSGEGAAEKEERLREKLKRGVLVGKRVGPFSCTPVRLWKPLPTAHVSIIDNTTTNSHQEEHEEPPLLLFNNSNCTVVVSARKLAAALWEFQHYLP
ncbi:hypothetical protein NC653_001103 [Populus alba x Populus x berolinensis]|uniref:Uncharacterized protein n=1 Tax=Populus alba x Populus x berolinensis TaxID=444605 RepID=A0AAD6RKF4_9ROSI|nr:hypothetical protein NC653_001103 [Populus alba x Populus x berolinensis]